jgi:hypothetical protein
MRIRAGREEVDSYNRDSAGSACLVPRYGYGIWMLRSVFLFESVVGGLRREV